MTNDDFLMQAGNISTYAVFGLTLAGKLIKQNDNLIKALTGQLAPSGYQKVINWLTRQIPQSKNWELDIVGFEVAWTIFARQETISKIPALAVKNIHDQVLINYKQTMKL